jgi:Rps23 Pro-64 3,4-dihydroxylase Tpa1-like proline 4-hydroxylase
VKHRAAKSVRRTDRRPNARAFKIGPEGRSLFVLDNLVELDEAARLYKFFRDLPYSFKDSDRFDTQAYRHFGYRFDDEPLMDHPVVSFFANAAISHLRSMRIKVGDVKRAYVNLNLYGDVQFAHEDGNEWTAVAFVNETWDADWGGELLVYEEPAASVAYAIRPAPGRMVVFDGLLTHRGGVPSKVTAEPRITLAIKMSR